MTYQTTPTVKLSELPSGLPRCSLEALHSATGLVIREWGEYGYRVEHVLPGRSYGGVILGIVASDGSRFAVESDRYGNARPIGDLDDLA